MNLWLFLFLLVLADQALSVGKLRPAVNMVLKIQVPITILEQWGLSITLNTYLLCQYQKSKPFLNYLFIFMVHQDAVLSAIFYTLYSCCCSFPLKKKRCNSSVPIGRILKIMGFKIISLSLEERIAGFCCQKISQVWKASCYY